MNIPALSSLSSGATAYMGNNAATAPNINNLKKQIQTLQKQVSAEAKNHSEDPIAIAEKTALLQLQIQNLSKRLAALEPPPLVNARNTA